MEGRLRVLVIERADGAARLVSTALERAGLLLDVQAARPGADLDAALSAPWDAVVLEEAAGVPKVADVVPRLSGVPLIVLSAGADEAGAPAAMAAGAADYVLASFPERLCPALRRELGRRAESLRAGDLERRLAECAREDAERYASLFDNHHAVMLLLEPDDGRIVDANPAAERFYGYSRSALRTMHVSDLNTLPPDQIRAEMARAQHEERQHFHFRHRLASGEVRAVEVYSGPIRLEGRTILYSIIHDESERLRAEEALRESEWRQRVAAEDAALSLAQLRAVLDRMAEGLILASSEGTVLTVNPAARVMLGIEEGFMGRADLRTVAELLELHDLEGSPVAAQDHPLTHALCGERFSGRVLRARSRPSGRTWYASFNGTPVRGADGEVVLGG